MTILLLLVCLVLLFETPPLGILAFFMWAMWGWLGVVVAAALGLLLSFLAKPVSASEAS